MRLFLIVTLIALSLLAGAVVARMGAPADTPVLAALGSAGYSPVVPFESCYADHCTYANTTLTAVAVPAGAAWRLDNVIVTGTVSLGTGASLHTIDTTVLGDVTAVRAAALVLHESRVTGDLSVRQGGGADVRATTIGGATEFFSNYGAVRLEANRFVRQVVAELNLGGLGLMGNTFEGDLRCRLNLPSLGRASGGCVQA